MIRAGWCSHRSVKYLQLYRQSHVMLSNSEENLKFLHAFGEALESISYRNNMNLIVAAVSPVVVVL